MIDLEQYRVNASLHKMCSEYYGKWNSCHSNKQIMDMALGVKAVDFLCDSIAKGWGLSPEYISERFKNFINGKYTSEQKGYTSKMYCEFHGDVKTDTTIVTLIDCDVELQAPNWSICEVYCTGKCKVNVSGPGRVAFVCYGHPDDIVITGSCGNMKRIDKKEADANG